MNTCKDQIGSQSRNAASDDLTLNFVCFCPIRFAQIQYYHHPYPSFLLVSVNGRGTCGQSLGQYGGGRVGKAEEDFERAVVDQRLREEGYSPNHWLYFYHRYLE